MNGADASRLRTAGLVRAGVQRIYDRRVAPGKGSAECHARPEWGVAARGRFWNPFVVHLVCLENQRVVELYKVVIGPRKSATGPPLENGFPKRGPHYGLYLHIQHAPILIGASSQCRVGSRDN